jgi:DNA-binding CsgD family transcriptional regulator
VSGTLEPQTVFDTRIVTAWPGDATIVTSMRRRLREVVATERRRSYVGRDAELSLFAAVLATDHPAFSVLHVHGVGGVGKTALLQRFAEQAARAGRSVVLVDGHDVEPNPASFTTALGDADLSGAVVVLVDSYELLGALDNWLREDFVAELSTGSLVVLAGRHAPAVGWRDDPGWRAVTRTLRLGNLSPDAAAAYLAGAGLPAAMQVSIAEATRGHPLALGLAADVVVHRDIGDDGDALWRGPDIVATLMARLLDAAPDAACRTALAACAVARFTTEASLRAAVPLDEGAHDAFEWLRGLSCIEEGPRGLYPHDLARDVLEADLRWRDEPLYWQLWHRTRAFIQSEIRTTVGAARREHVFDLVFTTRTDPVSQRYWRWETFGAATPEPVVPADRAAVLEIVGAHEGPSSVRILTEWWDRQPAAFTVYRRRGEVAGLAVWLTLTDDAADDAPSDPIVVAIRAHITQHGRLERGDEVVVRRFLADRDVYQDPSPAVDLSMIVHFEYVASRPQLTWIVIAVADPEFWAPQFAGIDFCRIPDADLHVDGAPVGLFARSTREPSPVFDPIRAAPGVPSPPSPAGGRGGSPLTARETQVAALVGRGLTNREIAATLVLSERTAQNHVQHILTKLGFANRSQIAAWTVREAMA